MSDDEITTSGGWCAPSETIYDASLLDINSFSVAGLFPKVQFQRGGAVWRQPTGAERRAHEAMHAFIARQVENGRLARHAAVDQACATAIENGWDIHVYEPPTPWRYEDAQDYRLAYLRSVGIEFTPAQHPVPTIVYHETSEWDDEWDDD